MWVTTKDGRHVNTDWFDKDRQIAENRREADERNEKPTQSGWNSYKDFGLPGTYEAYRAGDIFDSPLGFLTFGLDKRQSELYALRNKKSIESYTLTIKNPVMIVGESFDEVHEKFTQRFLNKSYKEGSTLEEKRAIVKQASQEARKQGYDAVLMDVTDVLSGEHEYEIGVLNAMKEKVIRRKR